MSRVIKWTHIDGETVEYENAKALADALGVGPRTLRGYLRNGISSDAGLPPTSKKEISEEQRKQMRDYWQRKQEEHRDKTQPHRKRHRKLGPQPSNYIDFIADMETWE